MDVWEKNKSRFSSCLISFLITIQIKIWVLFVWWQHLEKIVCCVTYYENKLSKLSQHLVSVQIKAYTLKNSGSMNWLVLVQVPVGGNSTPPIYHFSYPNEAVRIEIISDFLPSQLHALVTAKIVLQLVLGLVCRQSTNNNYELLYCFYVPGLRLKYQI